MARVDKLAEGIYRICTLGEGDFQFNQFLIEDERPALMHTGMYPSVMHQNGNWSVVAQNSEGRMSSARGGYVGRTVIAVVGLRRPGSAAEPTCASMTVTRDSIYMALAARARG